MQKIWQKTGWKKDEVDLYELNEAFSVQALGVCRELGLDMNRVNVNGGAVALGHPIGASGARVLVTLIYEMIRRDVHRGIAALSWAEGMRWLWRWNDRVRERGCVPRRFFSSSSIVLELQPIRPVSWILPTSA